MRSFQFSIQHKCLIDQIDLEKQNRIVVKFGTAIPPTKNLAMRSSTPLRRPHGCIVAYAASCCVADSPGFDSEFVIYRYSQALPAANIAFSGLHRDMPEEKLDLFEFAYGIMAEPRAGPPEIMWREMRNVHARGSLLDNVPNGLFRNAVSPGFARPTDTSKERTALDTGCR